MGYDMLEGSEMGALSESRLGNKCFVDDDSYSYMSKKKKKARADFERNKIEETWKLDQTKISDCSYLTTRLEQLQNTITSESEVYIKDKVAQQRIIVPLKRMETIYKNAISQAKCEDAKTKAEADATKKETLDLLTSATATPPSSSPADDKSSKTTKYIMYGIGGLILVLGVLVVLKKK
jgi:hypothetical protein